LAIDPAVFDTHTGAPWPDKGQPVVCHVRDGRVLTGTVSLVWLALDALCIDVETAEGRVRVFREFGDRCDVVT
jgi:hypothetical protein